MTQGSSLRIIKIVQLRTGLLYMVCWLIATSSADGQVQKSPAPAQDLARRAAAAREKGDVPAAISLYHQALLKNPSWQEGWWYYGSLLYDNNQYPQAVIALRRLTTLSTKLGGAWALLGLSEYETHDLAQALQHLRRAKDLGIGDNESLANVADYHLAVLLNAHGESDQARSLFSTLLLRGVNSEDVQVGLGMSLLRVPLLPSQLDPSKDALVHDAGTIAALLANRQYEKADAGFQDLLAKYPGTPFAHYAYGAMLASRGHEDLAKAQFREETTVTPDSALPYMEWAFLESRAGKYREALPLAQKSVELSPRSFLAHYLLGNALLATGSIPTSITQLETARRLAPDSPEIRYSLARAYAKAGKSVLARREQAEFTRLQSGRQRKLREGEEMMKLSQPENAGTAPSVPPSQ
jgi:tetratricopeptide (TPR) repeat protein